MAYIAPNFEARSLHVHRVVAEMIKDNPSEVGRAKEIIARWIGDGSSRSHAYFEEWARVIDAGVDECLKLMLDPSEHGDTLRSCSPFGCLLTPVERREIHRLYRRTS